MSEAIEHDSQGDQFGVPPETADVNVLRTAALSTQDDVKSVITAEPVLPAIDIFPETHLANVAPRLFLHEVEESRASGENDADLFRTE